MQQRNVPYSPVNQPPLQGYPQAQARAPYGNNFNNDDRMMIYGGALILALLVVLGVAIVAFFFPSCGCSGSIGSGRFGEMSIDMNSTGSIPFGFIENTTCVELDSYQMHHERGVTVNASEGYILAIYSGTYWYEIHANVLFDEHWLPWTPWKLYVGIDGKKSLREGSSHDILWWASNETFWSILPVIPHAPADLTLSGIVTLNAGQKLSAFIGIPQFCFDCTYNEAMIHGPSDFIVQHATVSMHALSPAGILKSSLLIILLALFLSF
jgi:hypothetical protein